MAISIEKIFSTKNDMSVFVNFVFLMMKTYRIFFMAQRNTSNSSCDLLR